MNTLLNSRLLSDEQKYNIEKSFYDSFYLLDYIFTYNGFELKITGSTLNVYSIVLKDLKLYSDCPCYTKCEKNNIRCKHICFVICYIGVIFEQKTFLKNKINVIEKLKILKRLKRNCDKDPNIISHYLVNKYHLHRPSKIINPETIVARNINEDCCICFKTMDDKLYICTECNNAIHNVCFKEWLQTNTTCVFCRNNIYLNISK
jgi:hypothetical protein